MSKAHHLQETALRYFLEVVRSGSLTEASQKLYVATSAISRQIAALERVLDVPLFERHARGMVPTAAGELLAAYARRSSLDAERIVDEIGALRGLRAGQVNLAATEGFSAYLLPELIAQFRQQYQGIHFVLDVGAPAEVSTQVRNGLADIGLTFSRGPERELQVVFHQPAPLMALMRADHPLAGMATLSVRQLSRHPLALPASDTTVHQLLDIVCSRLQLALNPVLRTNYMSALQSFVLQGGGISLFSAMSIRQFVTDGRAVAVPLRDYGLGMRDIEVQILSGRVLPHAVQVFLDYLLERLPQALRWADDGNAAVIG